MLNEEFGSPLRRNTCYAIIVIVFFIFGGRLYQLQLLSKEEYGKKSEENSIHAVVKEPIRGYMFDHKGNLIVDSRPSYTVTILPSEFKESALLTLSSVLHLDPEVIREKVKKGKAYSLFTPVRIKRDIDFPTLALFEENRDKLPGVEYQVETKRFYPTNARLSHLLGYTKEISEKQLSEFGTYYKQGDIVGSSGLESTYETMLRGERGCEFMVVNAKGQTIGSLENGRNDSPPKEGFDLYLSIDVDLQAFAEDLLKDKRGAVVALDPNNGEILALASKPDYDLSFFSGVTPKEIWDSLNTNPDTPLFNRATMTRYPPGSTFKMVLATAALQEKVVDTRWRITCHGSFRLGNKTYKCHGIHGSVNIIEAIQKSCNVFFFNLMLKTGLERWTKYGKMYGFGEPVAIDIVEENPGLLPSTELLDKIYGKGKWTQGYLVNFAIGQGEVGVTPLQMVCYAEALATAGTIHQPHAVRYIYNKRTNRNEFLPYKTRHMDEVIPETWDILREGLWRVVNEPGGTATNAKIPGVTVGGKTGTAENPHGADHSWFIGFAPFDHPKIVVAVIVENGGFGASVAAPIASLLMEKYLYGEIIRYKILRHAKPSTPQASDSTENSPLTSSIKKGNEKLR